MIPTTITCAECGGRDFLLHIAKGGVTVLRCVQHDKHVEDERVEPWGMVR